MFHPADKMRGKVFEIIEAQMRAEIEAAQVARLRKQSQSVEERPISDQELCTPSPTVPGVLESVPTKVAAQSVPGTAG